MAKNENETKRDKFALDHIKQISNLSDRSTYEFTNDDVIKIEKGLKDSSFKF